MMVKHIYGQVAKPLPSRFHQIRRLPIYLVRLKLQVDGILKARECSHVCKALSTPQSSQQPHEASSVVQFPIL